ncbi:hypothetical protein R1sor_017798 [Riccia sorocarpa]|uniref:Uncharacterized protein n=1 Tax=Riccia sorocarpa TaxID=122646 RepID=A0ABD3IBW3_9MARC
MIVTYLENPDNFAAINRGGRKTKITRNTLTKVTAFGHMAVTLCAQGFISCSGVVMGKKVARYVKTYKKAQTVYKSIGSSLIETETATCLTLEQKMNAKCHYFFRMHALFGAQANIEPHALGDAGLPADMEDDEVYNQTAPVANGDEFFQTAMPDVTGGDEFYQTARVDEDGGLEMGNQTGRSAVDVEANAAPTPQQNRRPQQSRGDPNVQSVDDVRSSGKTVRSRDRAPPPERKSSLIIAYEEHAYVKEKLVLRKEAQDQKASFRDAILEDRRQAREEKERARIQEGIKAMRMARADRRSTLMAEMVKTGKSMDEIQATFLLLDSVEGRLSASM